AASYFLLTTLHKRSGNLAAATQFSGQACAAYEDLLRANPGIPSHVISLLAAHLTSAALLLDSSRLEEAAAHLKKAKAIYEDLGDDNPARKTYGAGLVGALQTLGHRERLGGRLDQALANYEKARSVAAEFVRRHPNQQPQLQQLATIQHSI